MADWSNQRARPGDSGGGPYSTGLRWPGRGNYAESSVTMDTSSEQTYTMWSNRLCV